jgi:hypothetical protein
MKIDVLVVFDASAMGEVHANSRAIARTTTKADEPVLISSIKRVILSNY